ncbi:MAG: hypothetical protein JWP27_2212 [Flaviaesturariibacter sp.]|nr:hypothetical protein [Flaviaesturariibacter sp.]
MMALFVLLFGCLSAGTHGSINAYQYPVTKYRLAEVVDSIIDHSPSIRRDSMRNYMIDMTNGKNDTIENRYYNDDTTYQTIYVKTAKGYDSYIFRFGGGREEGDTSGSSNISVAYAYDEQGHGGSEGNGAFSWYNGRLKRRVLDVFESELVSKVDRALGVKGEVVR